MAIFRNPKKESRLDQDDVAILHLNVLMRGEMESRAWDILQESHPQLEVEIREAIAAILGPQFTAAQFFYNRGSIELFVAIAAGVYAAYVGVSKYKNFVESMTLLSRQVRDIVARFFENRLEPPDAVTSGWLPGAAMMAQVAQVSYEQVVPQSPVLPLLWYLLISHAALLGVFIWLVLTAR